MLNQRRILHAIGDHLGAKGVAVLAARVCDLREVALRHGMCRGEEIEAAVEILMRESLRPEDAVIRAGDECFALILPGLPARNHALLAATRLFGAFEQPLRGHGTPWQARLRTGVAYFPQDGSDAETLWRHAQSALKEAERRGEPYAFHDAGDERIDIDYDELRENIESNQLRVFFQAVRDLRADAISGIESLARWNSPTRGPVPPDRFITFAEQSDLIGALTQWSINATLRHAAALGDRDLSFSINLSTRALARGGVAEQLSDAVSIWGIAPTRVVAEVTETALVDDFETTVRTLQHLRDRGMRVAIDDFGTGYASLTYLSRFPATDLKIDKALVAPVARDARCARLAESIVQLAHRMDMRVTAEGIADAETLRLVTAMDCDYGQGFYLGMPQPAESFAAGQPSAALCD